MANEQGESLEQYSMKVLPSSSGTSANSLDEKERFLIVKRKDIVFDKRSCQLIKFTDISTYKWLKQKEEKHRLLTTLNASIHHEMLAPLNAMKSITHYLQKKLDSEEDKTLAEVIHISSKMLQLQMQDLLDNCVIEQDGFRPTLEIGVVDDVINEIILMMMPQITKKHLAIEHVKHGKKN